MDIEEIADDILEYLFGEWDMDDLETMISSKFPDYDEEKVKVVAERAAEFHVTNNNGNGYEIEDFQEILLGGEFTPNEDLY